MEQHDPGQCDQQDDQHPPGGVEDDGTDNAMRKYKRVEKLSDVDVTEFDGEGLISFQYAKR